MAKLYRAKKYARNPATRKWEWTGEVSASWYGSWTDENGRRRREALSENRYDAELLLHKRAYEGRIKRKGLVPKLDNGIAVEVLREKFVKDYYPRIRPGSRKRLTLALDTLLARLAGVETVDGLTPIRLEGYITERSREVSARTVAIEVGALKRLLNWGKAQALIAGNPIASVKVKREAPRRRKRALRSWEVEKLLEASKPTRRGIDLRPVWLTFLYAGLRKSELVELLWEDVDWEARAIYVRPGIAKTGQGRRIRIAEGLYPVLRGLYTPGATGHVFLNAKGRPWRNNLLDRFKRCVARAGLDPEGLNLHALRYTFVSELIRRGVNIKAVQQAAGHKDPKITLGIYAQVTWADVSDGVDVLDFSSRGRNEAQLSEHPA